MSDVDPHAYLLSDDANERVFREEIVPDELSSADTVDNPVVVLVAGQPGAGKTKTGQAAMKQFASRGGSVWASGDSYRPYHPEYHRLLAEEPHRAVTYVRADGRKWLAKAQRYLLERRVNVVVETTLSDDQVLRDTSAEFREAGYRVEIVVLAVPAPQSRLGILARYHQQVQRFGRGRLTEMPQHDAFYVAAAVCLERLDRERLVDVVRVERRGHTLLYGNELDDSRRWVRPPRSRDALNLERNRTWTHEETRVFIEGLFKLAGTVTPDWHSELRQIVNLSRAYLPSGTELDLLEFERHLDETAATSERNIDLRDRNASPTRENETDFDVAHDM